MIPVIIAMMEGKLPEIADADEKCKILYYIGASE